MAHILVIDDDDAIRSLVVRILKKAGHEAEASASGRRAIELVRTRRPDLIVTDLNMPEMDGIEVILALGEECPGLPIIAMSGGGVMPKELLLDNAGMLGAVETIPKPFDSEHLLATVRRFVDAPNRRDGD